MAVQANWISLDEVDKCMVAATDWPDFEGSWLNIGGPQRLRPPEVAEPLSRVFGHEIEYDPCTPKAFGDEVPPENRESLVTGITAYFE